MKVAELIFHRSGEDLLHVRLDRAETCIGSHPTNDVVVPEANIPDVAAVLVDRGAHRYKLRDLTGGRLRLHGQHIDADEIELNDGDAVEVGSYALELRIREEKTVAQGQTMLSDRVGKTRFPALLGYDGRTVRVDGDHPFNVGSDPDNDLVIDDGFVSGFHCRLTCEDGRWILEDLASTNGTLVNGLRVGQAELPSPATIQIGQAALSFELDSRAGADLAAAGPGDAVYFAGMLAVSAKMRRVFELIRRVADADAPVLITGDSGSGKELVARALHDESPRAAGPYLAINCGALASSIIEAELFGHVKGAFTGALTDKKGAFEAAQNGTLFLDEIGELPLELQPKLLRALESKTVRRVGGTSEVPIDTRIVAATHRNLRELVEVGAFREDLFHRLYVLTIAIAPLSERPEDVIPLARHFLATQASTRKLELSRDAENALLQYGWPGNVRELKNVILRAILLTDSDTIGAADLEFSENAFDGGASSAARRVRRVDEEERERILRVIEETGNNRAEAARVLGLSKSTFHDRLRRLGIPLKFRGRRP